MLNRVCLQGRFTHEPEIRLTSSQTQYCGFRLAVQRDFKNADGSYGVDFIDCVAWRNTAAFIVNHFHKGSMIVLDGRLQVDSFTNKNGENRTMVTVQVDNVNFGGDAGKGSTTPQQNTEPAPTEAEDPQDTAADTVPGDEPKEELPFEI